jgi:hypothetical protein
MIGLLHCAFWFMFAGVAYTHNGLEKAGKVPTEKDKKSESWILSKLGYNEYLGAFLASMGILFLGGVHVVSSK